MTEGMPPGYDEACHAIGRITIAWAGLEEMLFFLLHYLYHERGGDKLEPEIPEALSRRIKFLRRCARSLNMLDGQRQRCLDLADQIKLLSEKRHWCVHGVVANAVDRELGDILKFRRMQLRTHKPESEEMTMHALSEAYYDIQVLQGKLMLLLMFGFQGRSLDELDEMISKIRR